jgi:methionyl-tRNA synthetase
MSFAGERFSKSAGVTLDLGEAITRFGPDAFRYFLLREVPFDGDGNFSWERFEDRYTSDLANAFGNLASRVLAMVEKYRGGDVPFGAPNELDRADAESLAEYHAAMDGPRGYLLHEALGCVMQSVARGNEYIQSVQPWTLAKDPAAHEQLDVVLAALVRQLARHAICLAPFMPGKSQTLWQQLGGPGEVGAQRFANVEALAVTGWRVRKGDALFPRPQ